MATILREWSYRYQWFYDTVSRLAALSVGGEGKFRQLALQNLTIQPNTQVLDLCCGSGQATELLVKYSQEVTGLDASPLSLKRAQHNVPQAKYVEAFAQKMPFSDRSFDLVHSSMAMHEMTAEELRQILSEVHRVLKPGGIFTLVDFHPPTNWLFVPGIYLFLFLFETETAWQLLRGDLVELLEEAGFELQNRVLHAGGSLQAIQAIARAN
ncbi:class I SAM-dependent methyltransferase [Chroococcidiopsis sp. CCNUC1]|jgi:ubiquinone/menaquinone biosynthesis C-methylase UbiE|uniref:class I SAM-dependent methyltransferase n=1 Tax=Chroococcidiopsis sp. CCNUC1 TaxID=2653189 RepID=UPI0020209E4B|nr:class I SAM-dependent methyltransferase [Chroococcidiopsis sp. CCNUC1]URD47674.1 class I SAM-dependent methyltransferase [Chroococcidiopsis sp. CCNUC1]